MRNIKGYKEHLKESKAPEIAYRSFIDEVKPLYRMPWAPSNMTSERSVSQTYSIIDVARRTLSAKPLASESLFEFDPRDQMGSISFATDREDPKKGDLKLHFIPFIPDSRHGTQDHMNVYISSFGKAFNPEGWSSEGSLPFSVADLGRVLTEITGEPLDNTEANGMALAYVITDAIRRIEEFLGDRLEKVRKAKRSRRAFGRF